MLICSLTRLGSARPRVIGERAHDDRSIQVVPRLAARWADETSEGAVTPRWVKIDGDSPRGVKVSTVVAVSQELAARSTGKGASAHDAFPPGTTSLFARTEIGRSSTTNGPRGLASLREPAAHCVHLVFASFRTHCRRCSTRCQQNRTYVLICQALILRWVGARTRSARRTMKPLTPDTVTTCVEPRRPLP